MDKLTEEQKQIIKEIVGKIYRDGIAENMTRQDTRINELYELFFSLLQKEREAGKREGIEEIKQGLSIAIQENPILETILAGILYKESQSVEKGNDFKFDNKGNSIP